jgi:hypothetical protein
MLDELPVISVGWPRLPSSAQEVLRGMAELFAQELGRHFVGAYLHGSMVLNAWIPGVSDVDVLVVAEDDPDDATLARITERLFQLSDAHPDCGKYELSIVLREALATVDAEPPYVYHFSPWVAEKLRAGELRPAPPGKDRDLAGHFYVTRMRGVRLAGEPVLPLFESAPLELYQYTILDDVVTALRDLPGHPDYGILNSVRTLHHFRTAAVSSKLEGGLWGLSTLPSNVRPELRKALGPYYGQPPAAYEPHDLEKFRAEIVRRLNAAQSLVALDAP